MTAIAITIPATRTTPPIMRNIGKNVPTGDASKIINISSLSLKEYMLDKLK